jgi:hypothetical protein
MSERRARKRTYEFEVSFINEGAAEIGERRSSAGAASRGVRTRHAGWWV